MYLKELLCNLGNNNCLAYLLYWACKKLNSSLILSIDSPIVSLKGVEGGFEAAGGGFLSDIMVSLIGLLANDHTNYK